MAQGGMSATFFPHPPPPHTQHSPISTATPVHWNSWLIDPLIYLWLWFFTQKNSFCVNENITSEVTPPLPDKECKPASVVSLASLSLSCLKSSLFPEPDLRGGPECPGPRGPGTGTGPGGGSRKGRTCRAFQIWPSTRHSFSRDFGYWYLSNDFYRSMQPLLAFSIPNCIFCILKFKYYVKIKTLEMCVDMLIGRLANVKFLCSLLPSYYIPSKFHRPGEIGSECQGSQNRNSRGENMPETPKR